MSNKGNPTYGSLFAGVGGIDIGFDKANWDCKFQVEWDKHCQQTLAYHWPDVPRWGDVSDVNGAEIPPVDLITFGSPCQDLSLAGKRAGLMNGSRSNLFFEATRIIKEMRNATGNVFPKWAIWENVPGAFSSNNGDDLEAVIQEMVDIGGHHIEWHCVDAQFFGVPQRRRRVFVIACFDSAILNRGGKEILPISEGRRRNSTPRIKTRKDSSTPLATSFGTCSKPDDIEPLLIDGTRVDDVRIYESPVQTLKARMGTGGNNVPIIATDDSPILMRQREGKPGGGKGPLLSETSLTLAGGNDQVLFQPSELPIGFSHTQGLDAQPSEIAFPTLRVGGAGHAVAYTPSSFASYQEGIGTLRANGGDLGGGSESLIVHPDIAPTLRSGGDGGVPSSRGEHLVVEAIPIDTRNALRDPDKYDAVNRQGLGIGKDGEPSHTITGSFIPGVATGEHLAVEAYDEYNDSLGGNIHQALRAGTKQSTGVLADMVVRRLTPIECERLMGWPDNHTLYRADGTLNSDTTRYKMCGNGVASPVAEFIAKHLYDAHNDL